ncbi:hypothetical protein F7018_06635 [Tenacibaculum aiptasiae]|uniref:DUF4190 domain-containing protein n=1 Tax=Tenacibaculum aiptasiae TaxID=426481 RepID=A0A7J5ARD0_9FLAO|nr:hypothetical protein [Tenacibaculum aiptasiae]KAB1159984.1 hypothetical protein F7018_06635 [Tenacibaculum aiptasiae]
MSEIPPHKGQNNNHREQTIIIQQKETNGIGIAGFVLAIISLFLGWIPFFGWFLWSFGLILSFIGIFKKPKGLAIAGLIISLIGFILWVLLFIGLAVLGSTI